MKRLFAHDDDGRRPEGEVSVCGRGVNRWALSVVVMLAAGAVEAGPGPRPDRPAQAVGSSPAGSAVGPIDAVDATAPAEADDPLGQFLMQVLSVPALPARLVESLERGSQGVEELGAAGRRAVDVAEAMPANIREQVERLNETALLRAERITTSVEKASRGFADAGDAWRAVLEQYERTMTSLRESQKPEAEQEAGAYDFEAMARTTEGLAAAAGQTRHLLVELRGLIESDRLTERMSQVDRTAEVVVARTAGETRRLVDQVTWCAMQLILVTGGVVLVVRWCSRRPGERRTKSRRPVPRPEPVVVAHHASAANHRPHARRGLRRQPTAVPARH